MTKLTGKIDTIASKRSSKYNRYTFGTVGSNYCGAIYIDKKLCSNLTIEIETKITVASKDLECEISIEGELDALENEERMEEDV